MSSVTFKKRAILFDLDGVLVDSTIPVERSWRAWAKRNHLDPELVVRESHGRTTLETVRMFTPHLNAEKESAELDSHEAGDMSGVRAVLGAKELLAKIPAVRWAIATSGTEEVAKARLRHLGLPCPTVLISADKVRRGKPDPEPYLRAAAGIGFEPRDCLVIEDAPAGITSARNAGAQVIALTTTFSAESLTGADVVLNDLTALSVSANNSGLEIKIPSAAKLVHSAPPR